MEVANALRAAIRTRKFQPGEQLPSLNDLSKGYGVSLMTVQKAIGVLRDEGLVISRQGKGAFVRQRTERAVASGRMWSRHSNRIRSRSTLLGSRGRRSALHSRSRSTRSASAD